MPMHVSAQMPNLWALVICAAALAICVAALALSVVAAGCGSSEVKWYVMDGLEIVEGEVQFQLSEVTETSLGITSEELTELALAFDPSFFSGVTPGERITLGTSVGSSSFTSYLYANGYTEVAKNLVAFEIKGTAPSPGGE